MRARSTSRELLVAFVTVLFCMSGATAHAGDPSKGVAAVDAAREASGETLKALQELLTALKEAGLEVPVATAGVSLEEAQNLVTKGRSAYTNHRHAEALEILEKAISALEAPPRRMSQLEKQRQQLLAALVISSQAHTRLDQRDGAAAAIERLERAFPKTKIPFDEFGPESIELRAKLRKQRKEKLATLVINASPGGDLYIFGRAVGRDRATVKVPAGPYKIFAARSGSVSPTHSVNLKAGQRRAVTIKIASGAVLAKKLAERSRAQQVALLSAGEAGAIIGTIYNARGEVLRSATVSTQASQRERDSFIRALLSSKTAPPPDTAKPAHRLVTHPSRWSIPNKAIQAVTIGGGLGLLTAWAIAASATESGDAFKLRHNNVLLTAGVSSLAVGATFRWVIVF